MFDGASKKNGARFLGGYSRGAFFKGTGDCFPNVIIMLTTRDFIAWIEMINESPCDYIPM